MSTTLAEDSTSQSARPTLGQSILSKVKLAIQKEESPWSVFFGFIAERIPSIKFDGMNRNPRPDQIEGWLRQLPKFPRHKIALRMEKVASYLLGVDLKKPATVEQAAVSIAGDFEGYVVDQPTP